MDSIFTFNLSHNLLLRRFKDATKDCPLSTILRSCSNNPIIDCDIAILPAISPLIKFNISDL